MYTIGDAGPLGDAAGGGATPVANESVEARTQTPAGFAVVLTHIISVGKTVELPTRCQLFVQAPAVPAGSGQRMSLMMAVTGSGGGAQYKPAGHKSHCVVALHVEPGTAD